MVPFRAMLNQQYLLLNISVLHDIIPSGNALMLLLKVCNPFHPVFILGAPLMSMLNEILVFITNAMLVIKIADMMINNMSLKSYGESQTSPQ
mmetsp:Transcript_5760/g.8476  ORF Transcript_5760/g.8476 Transcript_5760/m.8476 type:complete len:92 (+) Transcript_5760:140-415(+)